MATKKAGPEKKVGISYWSKDKVACPVCKKAFEREVLRSGNLEKGTELGASGIVGSVHLWIMKWKESLFGRTARCKFNRREKGN